MAVDLRLADDAARLVAVTVLNREPAERAVDRTVLAELLTPQHGTGLQSAAADALARDPADDTADRLLAGWAGYTPELRAHVFDLLLTRDAWLRRLLKAAEVNEVPPGQIDAARRQFLLTHRDAAVRKRAEALFAGATRPDRQRVLREYQDVLTLVGDRGRGKAVFAKHCAGCHHLDGVGHAVGPGLDAMVLKPPSYLLQEILDPNRNVDSRYVEYRAVTKDGKSVSGVLAAESGGTIVLRGPDGRDQTVFRAQLQELADTGRSLMPEGFETLMARQELADVIAYLTGRK
ncbi:MAG: c-type cytochrome [Gemmataceae bacterium]